MHPSILNRVVAFLVASLLLSAMSEWVLATQPIWTSGATVVHAPDEFGESDRWFFLPTPPVSLRRGPILQHTDEKDTIDDDYVRPAWEMFVATVVIFVFCWSGHSF